MLSECEEIADTLTPRVNVAAIRTFDDALSEARRAMPGEGATVTDNVAEALLSLANAARKRLYEAAIAADGAWQAELVRSFKRDAGTARYQPRGKGEAGTPLRSAYEAWRQAQAAWQRAQGWT